MNSKLPRHGARHYTALDLGPQSGLGQNTFTAPGGATVPGKIFLREALGSSAAEISWNSLPPGAAMGFLHAHREHEEIYLFTGGEGEFQVDGEIFAVREGSVVRVAPEGARAWRNIGSAALSFIVLQVRPGTIDCGPVADGYPLPGRPDWAKSGQSHAADR